MGDKVEDAEFSPTWVIWHKTRWCGINQWHIGLKPDAGRKGSMFLVTIPETVFDFFSIGFTCNGNFWKRNRLSKFCIKTSIEIGVAFYWLFPSVTEISWNFPNLGLEIFQNSENRFRFFRSDSLVRVIFGNIIDYQNFVNLLYCELWTYDLCKLVNLWNVSMLTYDLCYACELWLWTCDRYELVDCELVIFMNLWIVNCLWTCFIFNLW